MPAMPAPARRAGGQPAAVVAHDQPQRAVHLLERDAAPRTRPRGASRWSGSPGRPGRSTSSTSGRSCRSPTSSCRSTLRPSCAAARGGRARAARSAGRGRRASPAAARGRCGARPRGCCLHRLARLRVLELEHHAGEHLADLVVQLARDPPALLLLRRDGDAAALAPLGLEPLEHVVEGGRQRRAPPRPRPVSTTPAPGLERPHRAHRLGQAPQRARRPRRSSTRLTTSETTNPVTRMTDWVSVTG